MDIARFINELQTCSIKDFKKILRGFDIKLSDKEIKEVYPLLQEISLSWLLLGVPMAIQQKLISILGEQRAVDLFYQLKEKAPSFLREN
ncbi:MULTISPECIES: hypothetical protein [Bacillaceae]|uniref:hypothetical protein n=1 Tax=Bacillaceae TaxID=186817 RepID=UPI0006AE1C83|nr:MULTISPECIES: hypothetical protein [Bacillaceae]ALC84951.1 hypothetical protein AM499_03300 [Bacillus sp. FJAT-22090]KQL34220.1 hypothetical protein AN959_14495 [Psychrobacillus sp. FJAT-21963]MDF2066313.1 hypothetical protein [Bacillus sp. Cr_A10]